MPPSRPQPAVAGHGADGEPDGERRGEQRVEDAACRGRLGPLAAQRSSSSSGDFDRPHEVTLQQAREPGRLALRRIVAKDDVAGVYVDLDAVDPVFPLQGGGQPLPDLR